jgi:lactate racemase
MEINFPYPSIASVNIPNSSEVTVLAPKTLPQSYAPTAEIIKQSLEHPVNSPPLRELAIGKKNVLILVDDHTRHTPADIILPLMLEELRIAGLQDKNIKILVASGTHRPMSKAEKLKKFGVQVVEHFTIDNHRYNDARILAQLPTTTGGTEIYVNKSVLETDLLIGIGHIVPHRVAGFSGGGKIVQPGVCGAITTGQTHWLSAQYPGEEVIGKVDNPVRHEIEVVANVVKLRFVTNVVMDARGKTAYCFSGNPRDVLRYGAEKSLQIFGVPLAEPADIVIADSYPMDIDLWIAAKGIYAGDLAVKEGGVLIFVSPCPEGVSPEYPGIEKWGYHPLAEVSQLVSSGKISDLTLAAHLVHVGEVISRKATCILVSPGIPPEIARKIGFNPTETPQQALEIALEKMGKHASIAVLKNGGEIMPVLRSSVHVRE